MQDGPRRVDRPLSRPSRNSAEGAMPSRNGSNIIQFRPPVRERTSARRDISGADSILFVCSSGVLSAGSFQRLETICSEATRLAHLLIRLEEGRASLCDALDVLFRAAGPRLRIQPIGLPLTDSQRAWLRGVAREWSGWAENRGAEVLFGPEPVQVEAGMEFLLRRALSLPGNTLEQAVPPSAYPS